MNLVLSRELEGPETIKEFKAGGLKLPTLALDELIAMKKSSLRPQDLEDAKALESLKTLK